MFGWMFTRWAQKPGKSKVPYLHLFRDKKRGKHPFIRPFIGVLNPFETGRGPPCRNMGNKRKLTKKM